jgi:hypothetical protein
MKNFIYILVCSLVLSTFISCSEDGIDETGIGRLTGTVVAAGSNEPLANVKITTTPASTTVFTNANGQFVIDQISAGEFSVQAQLDEYATAFEGTNITNGNTSTVVFELEVSDFNNRPPTKPILISPVDNGMVETSEVTFVWSASDPDDDDIIYSLELRNDQNSNVELFENITDTTYTFSPLVLGAKYFWQVTADDEINESVTSNVSTFQVIAAPTENRFLFVRNINGNNVIFSTDEEGNEFQLTSSNSNSFRPRRNIAANKIAYFQTTGAQVDIFTMNLDGTNKTKVTSSVKPNGFNLNEISFSWPANSDRIYFPNFDKLYSIRTSGQGLARVFTTTDGSLISEVEVSDNATIIALKTNNIEGYNVQIFTIDFNGNILDTILTGVSGAASGLSLSVTNQKIIYSRDFSGNEVPNYRRLDSRLYSYDFSTDIETEISFEKPAGTNDFEPRFSPNEAEVIFTNTSNDGFSIRKVVKIALDTTESRVELFNNSFMPDWE